MMKTALLTLFAAIAAEASTKVAVLEFGKTGTVRRTNSKSAETSVEGVLSFWSALHGSSSKVQRAGMSVVPDLFSKPDSGVVIGVSGTNVDLESLPFIAALFESNDAVGFMEVGGSRCQALMSNVPEWEDVAVDSLTKTAVSHGEKKGLTGVKTVVDSESALIVDQQLSSIFSEFKKLAEANDQTIVVHFVIEADQSVARRRLEDEQGDGEDDQAENDEDANEYSGYYGYGYYDSNGIWVTPFKTMFQIQYFNVVLWTAVGLFFALYYSIYLMVYMPLEPDTLLFGESAKLVGDD